MFETAGRHWSPLKRVWFLSRCNDIWEKDSLYSIKGHGFCIGGMTHLLLLGVDPWVIMVQGHWSSQSFLTYWHHCEEVLCLFISFSFQSHESILSMMSAFKARLTGWMTSLYLFIWFTCAMGESIGPTVHLYENYGMVDSDPSTLRMESAEFFFGTLMHPFSHAGLLSHPSHVTPLIGIWRTHSLLPIAVQNV